MRLFPLSLIAVVAVFSCTTLPEEPVLEAPVEQPLEEIVVQPSEQPVEPPAEVPVLTVIEQIPEEEDVYAKLSAAMVVGDVEEAIAEFEEAYTEDPEDEETRVLYSNLLLAAGEIEAALEVLEDVLVEQPDNTDALYNLALIEGLLGNEEEQEGILLKALGIDSDHAPAHASLGEIRLRNDMFGPARESFEKSLALEPDNVVALMGYGNVLLRTAEPEGAAEQFDSVIEQVPDYVFAYVDRSRSMMELGDYAAAEADMSAAIELDREYYWHYVDRGRVRLLGTNDTRGALDDFNRAITIDPDYFYAYIYRGGILDQLDARAEAIGDYIRVLDDRPDYYYIYAPLAVLLYMEQRWGEAEVYFRKAHDFEKREHFFPLLVALAMQWDGRVTEMKAYVQTARAALPRESLQYRVARLFLDPGSDGLVAGEISREDDLDVKLQALFVLASHYLIIGQPVLAQRYLLEIEDSAHPAALVRRLSSSELEQFRN